MKVKLNSYEKDVENNAKSYRNVSKEKMNKITSIIDEAKKTKNINIRISEYDLKKIKRDYTEFLPPQDREKESIRTICKQPG